MNTEQHEQDVPERPLGFWLRAVDARISDAFATALADEGVTRWDWMVLSALSGDVDAPGFTERIARKGKRLRALEHRGWVTPQGDGSWVLTDEGRAAQERLASIVGGIRERVAGVVPPDDYATTIRTLAAIARELGGDDTGPDTGRGSGRRTGGGFGRRRGFGPRPHGAAGGWHHHHDAHEGRADHLGPCHRGHGGAHSAHGREHSAHRREHAFARGFDAGYQRGRAEH